MPSNKLHVRHCIQCGREFMGITGCHTCSTECRAAIRRKTRYYPVHIANPHLPWHEIGEGASVSKRLVDHDPDDSSGLFFEVGNALKQVVEVAQ